jgi:hypothetical protein
MLPPANASRREWLVLPLIGVLTLIAIAIPLELVARMLFTESPPESRPCLVMNDPSTGVRGVPNSVCKVKTYESKWVEFKYNSCGHRAAMDCGPKPPGMYRIVMMGSSYAEGYTVSYEQSFGALLPRLLSRDTGHGIELYNEGMAWGSPHSVALRFDEVMAAQPDLILWPMTPWDIDNVGVTVPPVGENAPPKTTNGTGRQRIMAELTRKRDFAAFLSRSSRAFFMIQHLLYESESIYLSHSISDTDRYTPSLQDVPGAEWQDKLREYGSYVAQMTARAEASGVPLVVVALPRHAQAVMIAADAAPSGLNLFAFGDQLQRIVEKNGGIYVDVLREFRNVPNVNSAFYPVDQHLTVAGQALAANIIAKGLISGKIPALSQSSPPAAAAGVSR